MLKKGIHNHYFYQTKPKNQPNPKTNFEKQPEKMFLHTKLLQQQPKKKTETAKKALFILLYSLLAYFALR
jgi:hypothetical protein